ncbi:MAG: prophage regulatory protein [Porticoccus sp.]|jgi:prophage regulatory protein|uniref:helix-turn-helix transcriptional regulator n=1 Tax=Porticoccus sp. TaxID=2024853 RepID=UPI0039E40CAB|tara:strand:+ start:284210 stop:284491 length:282 start_codon:yes stop_codon:yes gene_type:complete
MLQAILRLPAVKQQSGLSRSTLYLRISEGLWTKPISLGGRSVGWPASEIETLNAARIAGKADDDIRQLVLALEKEREESYRQLLSEVSFSRGF